jgi:hypothetical protein
MRTPVLSYIYRLRAGWQPKFGVLIAEKVVGLRASTAVGAAHLHFLYILNRHEELSRWAWQYALSNKKYRISQMTLHMMLKSAWITQDDALLELIVDQLKELTLSNNNLVFIAMRRSAHPAFAHAAARIASATQTSLFNLDPAKSHDRHKIKTYVETLNTLEKFDVEDRIIEIIEQISGDPVLHIFLGRRAVQREDWNIAWDEFTFAQEAAPHRSDVYEFLSDTALYFPDLKERLDAIIEERTRAGVNISGYDKVIGYRFLLEGDYLSYLALRDQQVSNVAARIEYGANATRNMGAGASGFAPSEHTVFVIGRDGVSDELRWSYYYRDLQNQFSSANISCEPRLFSLFQRSFPDINFYPVARNWGRAKTKEHAIPRDKVPNMELASRLDNRAFAASAKADEVMFIEDVPFRNWISRGLKGPPETGEPNGATLIPDPDRGAYWAKKLSADAGGQLKVGLIWRSGLIDIDRRRHYMELTDFKALSELPIQLYSLQHQLLNSEREQGRAMGLKFVDDEIDLYNDFEEIAALTASLDLVIGISTLPYELASAVGTECWLCAISPLGRWMRLGQDGKRNDRLTRNGKVYFPLTEDGYLSTREARVDSIIGQIQVSLKARMMQ